MHLRILKTDETTYDLMGEFSSVGVERGSYEKDLDVYEKSFLAGANITGERRLASSSISLSIEINDNTDTSFRDKVNELYRQFSQIEYLEDTDNNLRTRVEFSEIIEVLDNNVGSILRGGKINIRLIQLEPFWEDLTERTVSGSGTNMVLNMNNRGVMPVSPIIDVSVTALCENILIYVDENKEGIEINDLAFGSASDLYDYEINCITGNVLLGDDQVNRNNRIKNNTGFFQIPIGLQDIDVNLSSSATVTVKWRNRYII